jgi:hypothetical protein
MRAVQPGGGGLEQGFDGQRRLAPTRHSGHTDELAQRETRPSRSSGCCPWPRRRSASCRFPLRRTFGTEISRAPERYCPVRLAGSAAISAGRAVADNLPAMHPGPRTHVEDIVRLADRILVMFHDQHGVPGIAQVFQRGQKPVVVALVQADGRLVQHVKHAGQPAADLARPGGSAAIRPLKGFRRCGSSSGSSGRHSQGIQGVRGFP